MTRRERTKVTSLIGVPINDAYLRGVNREEMEELDSLLYHDSIKVMEGMIGKIKVMVIKPEPKKSDSGVEPSLQDMIGTPSDRHLGTNVPRSNCETCQMDFYYCGGHEGFIPLPFNYIQYVHRNILLMILNSFCTNEDCIHYGKLIITPFETDDEGNPIETSDYTDFQIEELEEVKQDEIENKRSKIPQVLLTAMSEMSPKCGCPTEKKSWKIKDAEQNRVKQDIEFTRSGKPIGVEIIKRHLKYIDSIEYNREFFNINGWMFSDLILNTIHVLPLSKRPDEYDTTTMKASTNIITNAYNKILNYLKPVIGGKLQIANKTDIMHTLYSAVHLYSEQKTSKKNIETTLRGPPGSKSGWRHYFTTTRQHGSSGRTPIAGQDPEKVYDEKTGEHRVRGVESVSIPYSIAKEMHRTVIVNQNNIEKVNKWLQAGLISKYTPVGSVESDVSPITIRTVKMDIGYEVSVRMMKGDETLYTRQPILSNVSIGYGEVNIIKGHIMRILLSVARRYNADFDGDEMNMYRPGDREGNAEMWKYSITQNVLPPSGTRASYGINYINEYAIKEINKVDILKPGLFNEAWDITPGGYKVDYFDRLRELTSYEGNEDFIIRGVTPNQLFSVLFPPTFNYESGNLRIIKGIIISGKIDTHNITDDPMSIQAALYKDFNYVPAYIFTNSIDYLLLIWMRNFGFTVGPADLLPRDPINLEKFKRGREDLIHEVEQNLDRIEEYYNLTNDFLPVNEDDFNSFKQSLDNATRISGPSIELIEETFVNDENALVEVMMKRISGNPATLNQMFMPIGRIGEMTYSDIDKHSHHPTALAKIGFIKESFTEGISPDTMYEITKEGREKAIRKQVEVSKGGTFNYQLTSALSPFFVTDERHIMSIHGDWVDDIYGVEAIDDNKISLVKNGGVVYDLMDHKLLADVMTLANEPPDVPNELAELNKYICGLLYYYKGIIMYGSASKELIEDIRALGDIYNAEIVERYIGSVNDDGSLIEDQERSILQAYNTMIALSHTGANYKMYDVAKIEV